MSVPKAALRAHQGEIVACTALEKWAARRLKHLGAGSKAKPEEGSAGRVDLVISGRALAAPAAGRVVGTLEVGHGSDYVHSITPPASLLVYHLLEFVRQGDLGRLAEALGDQTAEAHPELLPPIEVGSEREHLTGAVMAAVTRIETRRRSGTVTLRED